MAAHEAGGIRCMQMRGGSSKGAYVPREDLPVDADDRADLLLRVMGSPDERQIDGIGGGHPLTARSRWSPRQPMRTPLSTTCSCRSCRTARSSPTRRPAATCSRASARMGAIGWTREERAKGQAWGLKTIDTFHTHGTPVVEPRDEETTR